ncbi:MAG: NAD(P)H-dependent glycerol-3-phosphate dehydrogenase [Hungatella sp.]
MAKVGIIGAGSWGIALSVLLHHNGHEVTVWSALREEITELSAHHEHRTLPGVKLPDAMIFTADLKAAMEDKDLLVLAVPSVYTRQTAHSMQLYCQEGQIVVNVAKGIEESTLMTLSEIIEEELPGANVAVLSGPSHAEEVSRGLPTTCVTGAKNRQTAEYIQTIFMSPVFRVYTSPDILGIELGGSLKNVVALAAGIADGLGYGDNTKAALITRGITEIAKLGTRMGGKFETFCGLSGIGDLIVTCASTHSRNRRAGILIGQGASMEEAMQEVKMVVEGVYSAKAALALSKKYGISMPIIEQVNQVLFEGKPAAEAVKDLMMRDKTIEAANIPWDQ